MNQHEPTIIQFPLQLPEQFLQQMGHRHGGCFGGRRGESGTRGDHGDRQGEGQAAGTLASYSTEDAGREGDSTASNGVVHFKAYAHLVSINPAKNRYRFYTLAWQPSLFGEGAVVRRWGRIGTEGQWRAIFFGTRGEAQKTVEEILKRRLGHGYAVVRWE